MHNFANRETRNRPWKSLHGNHMPSPYLAACAAICFLVLSDKQLIALLENTIGFTSRVPSHLRKRLRSQSRAVAIKEPESVCGKNGDLQSKQNKALKVRRDSKPGFNNWTIMAIRTSILLSLPVIFARGFSIPGGNSEFQDPIQCSPYLYF